MAFAMAVLECPRSINSTQHKRIKSYKERIRQKASSYFSTEDLLIGDLYIKIIYCHKQPTDIDIDNISKFIIDSLNGVIYKNDRIICQCHLYRVDLREDPEIISTKVMDDEIGKAFEEMENLIGQPENKHILYIEVGNIAEIKITPGPVEVN